MRIFKNIGFVSKKKYNNAYEKAKFDIGAENNLTYLALTEEVYNTRRLLESYKSEVENLKLKLADERQKRFELLKIMEEKEG